MSREGAIRLEGNVIETLPKMLYRVELPNGHRLLAFATGRERTQWSNLRCGDRVMVEMSPFDFSTGRLCGRPGAAGEHETIELV